MDGGQDEVQTGVGLTGHMWGHQALDVTPDLLCFGKKMQVCGVLASHRLDEVEDNVFVEPSRINSTWGGNLVDMVRCQRYLEIIHEEDLVANAGRMGRRLLEGLTSAASATGDKVSNVRGRGLMCAFDLPTTEARGDFLVRLRGNGVMALPCGPSTVRFRPPLNISSDEIDEGLEAIEKTAREM